MILQSLNFCVSVLSATSCWVQSFSSTHTSSFTCRIGLGFFCGAACSFRQCLLMSFPSGFRSHVSNRGQWPCTVHKAIFPEYCRKCPVSDQLCTVLLTFLHHWDSGATTSQDVWFQEVEYYKNEVNSIRVKLHNSSDCKVLEGDCNMIN